MIIRGWGNNKYIKTKKIKFNNISKLQKFIKSNYNQVFLPRGMGRSYGDSSLSNIVIDLTGLNKIIKFNKEEGILKVEGGTSFEKILKKIINSGWFLPVVAGTKYISIGGAVASDIHGKNHYANGCISKHIIEISYIDKKGLIKKTNSSKEDFKAVCGGMGLIGVIVHVTIKLKKINSSLINQKIIQTKKLKEMIQIFKNNKKYEYSVGWMDMINCNNAEDINSVIFLGNHQNMIKRKFEYRPNIKKELNSKILRLFLKDFFMRIFNRVYYIKNKSSNNIIDIEKFFFPLDSINNWNKVYGQDGFIQYQFIVPVRHIKKIINKILLLKLKPYLCVVKTFEQSNENFLSFPTGGISLAMDFKNNEINVMNLNKLNDLVLSMKGRVYLTKDSLLKVDDFRKMYPNWKKFKRFGKKNLFFSAQTKRLGFL